MRRFVTLCNGCPRGAQGSAPAAFWISAPGQAGQTGRWGRCGRSNPSCRLIRIFGCWTGAELWPIRRRCQALRDAKQVPGTLADKRCRLGPGAGGHQLCADRHAVHKCRPGWAQKDRILTRPGMGQNRDHGQGMQTRWKGRTDHGGQAGPGEFQAWRKKEWGDEI